MDGTDFIDFSTDLSPDFKAISNDCRDFDLELLRDSLLLFDLEAEPKSSRLSFTVGNIGVLRKRIDLSSETEIFLSWFKVLDFTILCDFLLVI